MSADGAAVTVGADSAGPDDEVAVHDRSGDGGGSAEQHHPGDDREDDHGSLLHEAPGDVGVSGVPAFRTLP